jgi:hypothetical protein
MLGPPIQSQVYQQLLHQEHISELAGGSSGAAQFVNTGLQIEAEQYISGFFSQQFPLNELLRMWIKRITAMKNHSEVEDHSLTSPQAKLHQDITNAISSLQLT